MLHPLPTLLLGLATLGPLLGADAAKSTGPGIPDVPALFDRRALVKPITELEGTLTDGSKSIVYKIVVRSLPPDHEMGPWAPATLKDKGGFWEDTSRSRDVDRAEGPRRDALARQHRSAPTPGSNQVAAARHWRRCRGERWCTTQGAPRWHGGAPEGGRANRRRTRRAALTLRLSGILRS